MTATSPGINKMVAVPFAGLYCQRKSFGLTRTTPGALNTNFAFPRWHLSEQRKDRYHEDTQHPQLHHFGRIERSKSLIERVQYDLLPERARSLSTFLSQSMYSY